MVSPEVVRPLDLMIFAGPFQLNYSNSKIFVQKLKKFLAHKTAAIQSSFQGKAQATEGNCFKHSLKITVRHHRG